MKRLVSLGLCLAAAPAALAQGLDVAIVAAATSSPPNCRFTDPQAKLMATGLFNSVDVFDAAASVPTLADLAPYDAVITWANAVYSDPVATGDAFADYVDGGGGVVVCMFALGAGTSTGTVTPLQLQGRWMSGYEIVDPLSGQRSGAAALGAVHDPSHPIMAGVTAFSGGTSSYRPRMTGLAVGAVSIADWSDGTVLVAVGSLPNRADLGMYPPSSDCSANFWDASTDGAALMANALVWTASGGGLGTNYCTANPNSTGAAGVMSAAGSTVASDNDLTLTASGLPPMQFGIFVTSRTQAQTPLAQGFLCVGGTIVRFQGPGQILQADVNGEYSLQIDTSALPAGVPTPIMPGETWNFTTWFRDVDPMVGNTANFADGVSITFQ